jgi:two-component system sensor histidine kinase ResE
MGRTLFHKLLASYLIIILVTLSVVGLLLSELFSNYYFAAKEQELATKGEEISKILSRYIISKDMDNASIEMVLLAMDRSLDARVLVIDHQGRIVATTAGSRAPRGMFLDTSDTTRVLQGEVISRRGFSPRFNQMMVSVAVPIRIDNEVVGALLLNTPVADLTTAVTIMRGFILYAAAGAILLAMLIGYYLSKSISRPLRRMCQITQEMSRGNFGQLVTVTSQDEVGQLARNFNELAQTLDQTITALKKEKGKIENILVNMAEGVLAVDMQGRIILANNQAAKTLAFGAREFIGRPLTTIVPYPELSELFMGVFQEKQAVTAEFRLPNKKFMLAYVSPLQENGEIYGAVAVLQDISELRQLEELRRDFVANVSHELRTPLTSIQAFVEALMDGLIEDRSTELKYLKVIHEESLRLKRLIHDLLDLSLMEAGKTEWPVGPLKLKEITLKVLEKLMPQIKDKALDIKLDFPPFLPEVFGNMDRIEQVLINLISNAIRFTPKGGKLEIKAIYSEEEVEVSVLDNGSGIPAEDLPYIWDRFHKVDKSRARGSSGTGLGLAIVKHIIAAHGGKVSVKSKLGEGSAFTFSLPIAK